MLRGGPAISLDRGLGGALMPEDYVPDRPPRSCDCEAHAEKKPFYSAKRDQRRHLSKKARNYKERPTIHNNATAARRRGVHSR
ncbi:hypothetical protein MTO96_006927 [Rhipicephalus appendiculatus]